jgi:hypothetical protein
VITTATAANQAEVVECWCCGQQHLADRLVRLCSHPEVAVCLGCAHFLHRQAGQREDALRPSIATRLRDTLRGARHVVMDHGWHQRRVIGRPLRWLGRYLP